jgi:ClpP class serine protease
MAHSLRLLTKKLYNTPHLIEPSSFESVITYLKERNQGEMNISAGNKPREGKQLQYYSDTQVGIIDIDGPLTYKSSGWEALCGGTSYEGIVQEFNAMSDMGMKTLVFMADSGGGEAYGMQELGSYIRKQADAKGIKILTYVDGMAASACYGVTCIADEVILNPQAEVGSIGVVVRLMNDSKALEEKGYERSFVYAGGNKVPFAEDGSFRPEFIQDIQVKVDALYEEFTSYVASMRKMDVDQVKKTEAKVFMAKDAISLGLADKVMTHDEFYNYLADVAQKDNKMFTNNKLFSFSKQPVDGKTAELEIDEVQMKEFEELQAQHSELEAKFNAQETELAAQLNAVASLSAELAQAKEELSVVAADRAALETAAKEAKVAARKEAIASVEADAEQADKLYASLETVDDAAFNVVLASMKKKEDKLETSDLFEKKSTDVNDETKEPVSFKSFLPTKNK